MNINSINKTEYPLYAQLYIDTVLKELQMIPGITGLSDESMAFFESIPDEKWDFSYDTGKWSIKEVVQHIIDTERIFVHRLFRIGRGDATPLPGYDENTYITPSKASEKSSQTLLKEYQTTRDFTLSIIESLHENDFSNMGEASGFPVSARALVFIIIGHELHHIDVLKTRYLL